MMKKKRGEERQDFKGGEGTTTWGGKGRDNAVPKKSSEQPMNFFGGKKSWGMGQKSVKQKKGRGRKKEEGGIRSPWGKKVGEKKFQGICVKMGGVPKGKSGERDGEEGGKREEVDTKTESTHF